MSFILDALKRAERERRIGQAPTVETLAQAVVPAAEPRRLLAPLLIAATLLIGGLAGYLLLRPRPIPATAPLAVAPEAAVPVRPAPAAPVSAAPPDAIDDPDAIASLDDLAEPGEEDGGERPAPDEPATTAASAAAAAPLQPVDIAAEPAIEATPATAAPEEAVPLRDTPDSYRSQFPALSFDVHVFNDEPARRWVMIGGQRYREQDALPGGGAIAAIRADGVVIDFQNRRVLVPVR